MPASTWLDPVIRWRAVGATACIALPLAMGVIWWADPGGCRALAARLQVGMSEADVVAAIGQPPDRRYERGRAPADDYVPGWSRRVREVTHQVLIFRLGEPSAA